MRLPAGLSDALLGWFAATGRDLPWRRTRDPWAVLVSEVMLQQTQVARVQPRYGEFLARFPTPAACAEAPPGEVVARWEGLGYNRRALQLHAAAGVLARNGAPTSVAGWQALPGIGPYTARAVMAFAGEADVGVVDVNAARVLTRLAGQALDRAGLQAAADAAVPAGRGWAWNQAVLEMGAIVCTRRPACDRCPVAGWCGWSGTGPDPARVPPRQAPFAGSDRQGRGRLVAALRAGPVAAADLARVMGWPDEPERAERVASRVVADGLATVVPGDGDGARYRLPGPSAPL